MKAGSYLSCNTLVCLRKLCSTQSFNRQLSVAAVRYIVCCEKQSSGVMVRLGFFLLITRTHGGISNRVWKRCVSTIYSFKNSLHDAMLPKDWKLAHVTPIHKEGDKGNAHNYRPLSLTSVCSKTLEHTIYSGLMKHLQDNDFFTATQHGFRSGLSCTTQLTEFIHDKVLAGP